MAELTNLKHEMFCREFLVDLNGTKAYSRVYPDAAKTSARRLASQLLTNVDVKKRIYELAHERAERVEVTADDVVRDLIEVKNRCMQTVPVTKHKEDDEGEVVEIGEFQFNATGALKSLELLGRHLKMFTDKIEVGGINELAQKMKEARDRAKKEF
jgi:phage terminase small subunit